MVVIIYGVLTILAILYPENPVPNEALIFLLIANLWAIHGAKK